jgi:NAD(P)-dependent dehydrogenase (short-subunit alcohol dehydrogenase family)
MPTAIITGASRGLGLALARSLAERGWNLILDARGDDALKEAAEALATWPMRSIAASWWKRPGPLAAPTCW